MTASEFRSWSVPALDGVEFLIDQYTSHYPHHVHDSCTIDILESGVLRYGVGNRVYIVRPGAVIWVDSNEVHSATQIGGDPVVIRSILVPQNLIRNIRELNVPVRPVITDRDLHQHLCAFHKRSEQSMPFGIEQRFIEMIRRILAYRLPAYPAEHAAVQKMRKYFGDHYAEPINLDDLAAQMRLNKSYLVRMFRKSVGLPPYTYLTELRIARARVLLSRGMPPVEVAASVGLSDQSHLTRLFKRSTGMTPGMYASISKPVE